MFTTSKKAYAYNEVYDHEGVPSFRSEVTNAFGEVLQPLIKSPIVFMSQVSPFTVSGANSELSVNRTAARANSMGCDARALQVPPTQTVIKVP